MSAPWNRWLLTEKLVDIHDSSVRIVTRVWASQQRNHGNVLHSVQSGSGVHETSWGLLPRE
jgi:hypothetical protein